MPLGGTRLDPESPLGVMVDILCDQELSIADPSKSVPQPAFGVLDGEPDGWKLPHAGTIDYQELQRLFVFEQEVPDVTHDRINGFLSGPIPYIYIYTFSYDPAQTQTGDAPLQNVLE